MSADRISVYALVTARGGSKRLPRKNLRLLGGKPLVAWTIETACQACGVDRILLSTEDEEIASIGREAGAEVPFRRPAELANDTSSHIDVVLHALRWLEENEGSAPDYLLTLQPTSPFRTKQDVEGAIDLARKSPESPAVVAVCECVNHPYFAQRILPDGTLEEFTRRGLEDERCQAIPKAYVPNGAIYLNRVAFLFNTRSFLPSGARAYVMPQERSLDIDTFWDFYIAELMLRNPYGSHSHGNSRA